MASQPGREWRALRQRFYERFDPSRIEDQLRRRRSELRVVGEGLDFITYLLPGSHLVAKLAKEASPSRLATYLKVLNDAYPPHWLVTEPVAMGEETIFVQLYADQERQAVSGRGDWQSGFSRDLEKLGFEINDLIQWRCIQGLPVVYDFSDLKPL